MAETDPHAARHPGGGRQWTPVSGKTRENEMKAKTKTETEYQLQTRGVVVSRHRGVKAAERALQRFGAHGILVRLDDYGKAVEIGTYSGNGVEWDEAY